MPRHASIAGRKELDQELTNESTTSRCVEVHGTPAHAELAASRNGPLTLISLFQPLLVRQYLHNGKLHKEATYRRPSRFELFFDLGYGGVAHLLAEEAAEAAAAPGVGTWFRNVQFPVLSRGSDS